MQATLPPSVWWELERWRQRGSRGGGRGAERRGERSGGRGAEEPSLVQMQWTELQRLRDLHALIDRQRLSVPDILYYAPSRFGNVAVDTGTAARPTTTWRQRPQWHHSDFLQPPVRQGGGGGGDAVRAEAGAGAGDEWGAARGWAAGALLLLAALLLVRAADRCLARSYCTARRRRSEEWPTPSVLATTQRPTEIDTVPNTVETFHSESSGASNEVLVSDLPPPYSECAGGAEVGAGHKRGPREEPPPPYSVVYSGHKHGAPSVRIHAGHRAPPEIAHSSNGYLAGDGSPHSPARPGPPRPARAPLATEDMAIDSDDTAPGLSKTAPC